LAIKIFWSTGDNVGVMSASGSIWEIERWPPGWTVCHVDETGSTNTDLLAALDDGTASHRFVLVADHQTSGRGRLDRTWEAPPGTNLLVSVAFTHVPQVAATLTQRIGLAVVDGIRSLAPDLALDLNLKWPNDVLLDGRKLAGILAQRSMESGAIVVGVGLNVGWAPDAAAKLDGKIAPVTVSHVLSAILASFDALPADCADRYRSALDTLGREVRVELPGDRLLLGRATDVDPTGRLVVEEPDGTVHHLDVGDVIHATAFGA
jgi:BirA family transcriptional regulator, biotin operon repressor / biotin---[acetyl-CoA-carboxylase] ligase